jgi:predicted nucleic acid-binding protein
VRSTAEIRLCRDPRDDKFLEAALAGRAARVVMGDADLLALGALEDVRIVTPSAFVAEIA